VLQEERDTIDREKKMFVEANAEFQKKNFILEERNAVLEKRVNNLGKLGQGYRADAKGSEERQLRISQARGRDECRLRRRS
jgi:hypothetical protein